MMKFFLCLCLSFVVMACDNNTAAQSMGTQPLSIVTQHGAVHSFKVEMALTQAQQMQGLMNRTSLAPNAGMLFVFGNEDERQFWMKNTLIPLDIIFIKKDGTIHHIHDNAKPLDLTGVPSNGPVMAVLELNGGLIKRLNIAKGDVVHHIVFGN